MSQVEYRDVPGFPGYRVGNDASVWSKKRKGNWLDKEADEWRRMKVKMHKRGPYPLVTLIHEGKYKTFFLHRLVLLCFVGPPPTEKHLGLHRDDDKTNIAPDNLYWGTHRQNMDDAMRNGHVTRGEKNGRVKLTEEQAMEILRLRAEEGLGCRKIAKMVGMSFTGIQKLLDGTTWSYLKRPTPKPEFATQGDLMLGDRNPATKLKPKWRDKIKSLYATGEFSQQDLAELFGVHQTRISSIVRDSKSLT